MRKFILNIIIFGCVLSIFCGLLHYVLMYPQKKLMALHKDCTTVFLGNSTVEYSVNDSLVRSSFNFARGWESLVYVYAKLQLIKENNPQIDTVFIGFDDIILLNGELVGNSRMSHLYFVEKYSANDWIMNLKEFSTESNYKLINHIYHIRLTLPVIKSYFSKADIRDLKLGGYSWLVRDKLAQDIERRKDSEGRPRKTYKDFPIICRYYVDNILDYCRKKDITVFFINIPKHKSVWADTVYRDIHREYYPDVPLIDCMQVLLPDSCFGDCIHLNYKGARMFAPILSKCILLANEYDTPQVDEIYTLSNDSSILSNPLL